MIDADIKRSSALPELKYTAAIVGDSEMARRIRQFDWASNTLGPVAAWPQSLITSVNIVLQSPVPIVMLWGADGIMLYNDAYSEFAGARHPYLLGTKVVEGWPEVADFNRNVMKKGLAGKTLTYKDQTLTLYRNNAPEEVSMDLTYSPITDESGKPNGVLAIVFETTERVQAEKRQKAAEAALVHERERLKSLFMQAPAMVAVLNGPDMVFELANPLYMQLVGNRSIIGKPVKEALPELKGQEILHVLETVYTTGKPYFGNEIAVNLKSGKAGKLRRTYFNFVYQPSFDEQKKVDGILVHAVEVTDQVLARHQVEEIANLNKSITDNASTGLLIMDINHMCTFMNPAAEKITGYTFEQIKKLNKPLHAILHYKKADGSPYPIEECATSQAIDKQRLIHAEDMFVRKDGSMYPVAMSSSPIMYEGVSVGIVQEIRDISREKQAEEEILQLNRELEARVDERTQELTAANKELGRSNEELQDFAYVASHDLQEPLRKIAAFSNLLEEDYRDILPPEAHVYLQGLKKSSVRMRTLINDLLTYSRVTTQAQPYETIDLHKITLEVIDDLQSRIDETKAAINVGKLPKLEADPLQMRLLLQNLLSNALKYSKTDEPPIVRIYSENKGGWCTIYVSDNGIGFNEQYLDRIFTIFQRLHGKSDYEGTGVGLAITKKIVDRHGGTITAQSSPGKGSTFMVRLPLKQNKDI